MDFFPFWVSFSETGVTPSVEIGWNDSIKIT